MNAPFDSTTISTPTPIGPFDFHPLVALGLFCEIDELFSGQDAHDLHCAVWNGYLTDHEHRPGDYGKSAISSYWRKTCLRLKIPYIRFIPQKKAYTSVVMDLDYAGTCIDFDYREPLKWALNVHEYEHEPQNCQEPTLWSLSKVRLNKINEVADLLIDAAVNHSLTGEQVSAGTFF